MTLSMGQKFLVAWMWPVAYHERVFGLKCSLSSGKLGALAVSIYSTHVMKIFRKLLPDTFLKKPGYNLHLVTTH